MQESAAMTLEAQTTTPSLTAQTPIVQETPESDQPIERPRSLRRLEVNPSLEQGLLEATAESSETSKQHVRKRRPNPLEASDLELPLMLPQREDTSSPRNDDETLPLNLYQELGLTEETVQQSGIDLDSLKRAWRLDYSRWRGLRWANLEILPEKSLLYFMMREADMATEMPQPNPHHFIAGNALPLRYRPALRRIETSNSFVAGFELTVQYGLKFSLYALLGYQLVSAIRLKKVGNFFDFIASVLSGNKNSIYAILKEINSPDGAYLAFIFAAPFVFGAFQSLWTYCTTKPLAQKDWESLEKYFHDWKDQNHFWTHGLSWAFPFTSGKRNVSNIVDALLWDGSLTNTQREQAFQWIQSVAEGGGYARLFGYEALAQLAQGISLKQWRLISTHYDEETCLRLLKIKTEALRLLQAAAPDLCDAWREDNLRGLICALYAHYLKWTLADSNHWKMSVSMLVFKLGKTAFSLLIISTFLQALFKYLACPNEFNDFTLSAGFPDWVGQFTEECLAAFINLFNSFPGQPPSTLIDVIQRTRFTSEDFILDFSNKALTNGTVVAQVLEALYTLNVNVIGLNLSGNYLNTGEAIEAMIPYTSRLQMIDLSYFPQEGMSPQAALALSRGFRNMTSLRELYLINNGLGETDSSILSSQYIAYGIRVLSKLRILDLSYNNMGEFKDDAVQILAASIANMPDLMTVNFAFLAAGISNSTGIKMLSSAVSGLKNLTSLSFPMYDAGFIGGNFIEGFIYALHQLGTLTTLKYLRFTGIYGTTTTVISAMVDSFANFTSLETLILSTSLVGRIPENVYAIATGIALHLRELRHLDLSNDGLGDGADTLATALYLMPNLTYFGAAPMYYAEAPILISTIRALEIPSNLPEIIFDTDATQFLSTVNQTTISIDLTGKILTPSPAVFEILLKGLCEQAPLLKSLNLNNNRLGEFTTTNFQLVRQYLSCFRELQSFSMQNDFIEINGIDGSIAAAQALQNVTTLRSIDYSNNLMGVKGPAGGEALAISLENLHDLRFLNLSNNIFGYVKNGESILNILSALRTSRLEVLDISQLEIDRENDLAANALADLLPYINSTLKELRVGNTFIGSTAYEGSLRIAKNLYFMTRLEVLDFSNQNNINTYRTSSGEIIFIYGQGFGALNNSVLYALAEAIPRMPNLRELYLAGNVGAAGPEGPARLLPVLTQATNIKVMNLQGWQNVTWQEGEAALANIQNAQLNAACQAQICFGTTLQNNVTTMTTRTEETEEFFEPELDNDPYRYQALEVMNVFYFHFQKRDVAVSEYSRPAISSGEALMIEHPQLPSIRQAQFLEEPWVCYPSTENQLICTDARQETMRVVSSLEGRSWSEIGGDRYEVCEDISQAGFEMTHCVGEKTEFFEMKTPTDQSSSIAWSMASACLKGAAMAVLPEALGDILHHTGLLSSKNVERLKLTSNLILVLATGSYLAAGASMGTQAVCRYLGCSEGNSRIAGNTAAFFVSAANQLTPLGVAATAVNFAVGKAALLAESRIVKWAFASSLKP